MSEYRKRSEPVKAITFDELVQHGIATGGNIVNGMPWSFKYNGLPITHENDDCYLIPSPTGGSLQFNRGDMLVTCGDGALFPMSLPSFCMYYECDLVLKPDASNNPMIIGYISTITAHKLRSGANLCVSILQKAGKHHSVAVYLNE